jgi:hypothetical protein
MQSSTPIRAEILSDLFRVKQENGYITRDLYVTKGVGKYPKREILKHWNTFAEALSEIGLLEDGKLKSLTPGKQLSKPSSSISSKPSEVSEVSGDNWTVSLPKTRIHTLKQLIEYFEVDTSIWTVKSWIANKWDMGYTFGKQKNKKAAEHELYQVKATFEKKPNIDAIKKEIELLKDEVKSVAVVPKTVVHNVGSGNLLELLLPDLHAGKLCWSKETGYKDYETSIAIETYRRAMDGLLSQCANYEFDRIILGVGNDLLQSDNIQGTTYSGTKVDTDTRFHKTYKVVREMLSETIEKLRLIAPVEVKMVSGNHDTLSVFTLGDSLECRFHNYPDVIVDNSPMMHKTVEWGDVFLILTHGHQGKQADYGIWMASAYPKEFGRTKFREIHVGHKHKSALDEKFGVRVRVFSSLTEADAWHAHNNFVNNLRVAEALVWSKQKGLVAQFYHTEI